MRVTADRITFVDRSGKVEIWGRDNPYDSKRQGLTPSGYVSYRGDTGRVVQLNEEWHAMQAVFIERVAPAWLEHGSEAGKSGARSGTYRGCMAWNGQSRPNTRVSCPQMDLSSLPLDLRAFSLVKHCRNFFCFSRVAHGQILSSAAISSTLKRSALC